MTARSHTRQRQQRGRRRQQTVFRELRALYAAGRITNDEFHERMTERLHRRTDKETSRR